MQDDHTSSNVTVSCSYVFNIVNNKRKRFYNNHVLVDLQSEAQFQQCHIATALSLPASFVALAKNDSSDNLHQKFLSKLDAVIQQLSERQLARKPDAPPTTLIFYSSNVVQQCSESSTDSSNSICHELTSSFNSEISQVIVDLYQMIQKRMDENSVLPNKLDMKRIKIAIMEAGIEGFVKKYGGLMCNVPLPSDESTVNDGETSFFTVKNPSPLMPHVFNPNCYEITRNTAYPSEIIDDFLFLGTRSHANDEYILNKLNIRHVLNATNVPSDLFGRRRVKERIMHLQISLIDLPHVDIKSKFTEAIEFITKVKNERQPGEKLLVHCEQGISRSASLVIAYLMVTDKLTCEQATNYVKMRRKLVQPNPGFRKQLAAFDVELELNSSNNI